MRRFATTPHPKAAHNPRYSMMGEPVNGFRVWDLKNSRNSATYANMDDAMITRNWLNERAAGYPTLAKFEGGANWPVPPVTIATRSG